MQPSESSYSCRLFRYCGNDMSDTNSSAVSTGLNFVMWCFILPAVYISRNALRSKAVAFTWLWELKLTQGWIDSNLQVQQIFDPAYWLWQSKLNPVQPASFFSFLMSFCSRSICDCVHISQLLAEGGTQCSSVICCCSASLFHVQFHVCVQRWSATHLNCQKYFELGLSYPSVMLRSVWRHSTDFWHQCCRFKERIADCWIFFFHLLVSLKPREILICSLWNPQTSLSGATTMPHLL